MAIRILHSIPKNDKFGVQRKLLFSIIGVENTYAYSFEEYVDEMHRFDVLIVHYLRIPDAQFILDKKIGKPLVWFCWGADLFGLGNLEESFFLPVTRKKRDCFFWRTNKINYLKNKFKAGMPRLYDRFSSNSIKIQAIKKMDVVVPVIPADFSLLSKYIRHQARYHRLNLVNPIVASKADFQELGKNILLGNSASMTNNHFDAIDWLSTCNIQDRKVIIPLSYGSPAYATMVHEYALKVLGDEKIMVLKDFLTLADYNKYILSCEIVLMNHLRQEAMGNIIMALFNGAHLYMQEESPVYLYLKEMGFNLSAINQHDTFIKLSYFQMEENRMLVQKEFGKETQHSNLRYLLKIFS